MKRIYALLILTSMLLTLCLSSCTPKPAYEPGGEVYAKTSPVNGDGGDPWVVDITLDCAVYAAEGDLTVPVRIGMGHHPRDREDGDAYGYLEVKLWMNCNTHAEPNEVRRIDLPAWESSEYNSTEPEERPWYFFWMPVYYGEFYPLRHETVKWDIPSYVTYGYLTAQVFQVTPINGTDYRYNSQIVKLAFERVDGELLFVASD